MGGSQDLRLNWHPSLTRASIFGSFPLKRLNSSSGGALSSPITIKRLDTSEQYHSGYLILYSYVIIYIEAIILWELMSEAKTTLQISEDLRRKLKVYASMRDIPYEDLLADFIQISEALVPFKDIGQFAQFFEKNTEKFGLGKIRKKVGASRYLVEDQKGNTSRIQLELFANDYSRRTRKRQTDLIVAVVSIVNEIEGVPVKSLVSLSELGKLIKEKTSPTSTLILIPTSLYNRIEQLIKDTSFSNPQDYVTFVLREVVAMHEQSKSEEPFTKEDIEQVKERLRALGYL